MATVNTTWVSPASGTLDKATSAIVDETMTDAWSSDLYHLGGTLGYIGCRANSSAVQSIANNTGTLIALGAESFDSDPNGAMHDNVTNNSRITIRTAGVYHVSCWVSFAANGTGARSAFIRVNGGSNIAGNSFQTPASGGSPADCTAYTAYAFNATDYVEIVVFQASGGALDATSSLSVMKA